MGSRSHGSWVRWISDHKSREGLNKFAQSGKANDYLLQSVREANDVGLELELTNASNKLGELSLLRR
jgi:hypothetical protein